MRLVHENLASAWKIHKNNQMCYIFDYVNPVRQWKCGSKYTDKNSWAEYGPGPPWPDITESNERKHPQKPYYPRAYMYVDPI